jgi:TrmH family RNA methyltransferase
MSGTLEITSRQNPRLKAVLALKSRKGRREQCRFLAEGVRLLSEIRNTPETLLELWISYDKAGSPDGKKWTDFAIAHDVPVFILPEILFNELSDTVTSQGLVGVMRLPQTDLDRFLGAGRFKGLLLDGIQDPGNLGTIIRTAEAMGFSFVLIPQGTTDPFGEKSVRASMGSIFHIPIVHSNNILLDLELLKDARYEVAGALLESSTPSHDTPFGDRLILTVGNEGTGISKGIRAMLDYSVHIPMTGRVESLNAAAAVAMLAYEIQRRELIDRK